MAVQLEHVNVTVSDPEASAAMLGRLFGWKTRWAGPSKMGGHTVPLGNDTQYVALYRGLGAQGKRDDSYGAAGALNHIAVVVDDLSAMEKLVLAEGIEAHSHADYEPGRRFYFNDSDGIEYEVVSYAAA